MWTSSDRLEWISVAVVKPMGTILHASDKLAAIVSWKKQLTFRQDLVGFGLTDPLDRQKLFLRREGDCFNSVVASFDQLVRVGRRYARFLSDVSSPSCRTWQTPKTLVG